MSRGRVATTEFGGLPLPQAADRVLDRLSSAIYTTDQRGVITYFNAAAAELWGCSPTVGLSHWCGSFRIFTTEGDPVPHDECPMAQCLQTGIGVRNAEIVVERPDGTRCNVLVSPQPIVDDTGTLIGAVNTLSDITDLRHLESAGRASATLATSILQHSQDCIKILDLDGALRTINPCGCTSLEIQTPDAAIGMNYFEFWQGEDREKSRAAAEQARSTGAGGFVATFTSASGKVTTWDERMSMIADARGAPTGYLVISRDVTQTLLEAEAKSRQLRQQKTLSEIGALALRRGCFDQFLAITVAMVAEALRLPMVKILAFADAADRLNLRAGVGWAEGRVGHAEVGIDGDSQAGFTLMQDGPVIVEDLRCETRFRSSALMSAHHVRSGISVRIPGAGARPFGVLAAHSDQPRRYDENEVDYLVSVANLIASCHLHVQATRRQELLVREVAHRAGNMLQFVNSIFNQTVRETGDLVEAKAKFQMRLAQMSRANVLVSSDGWTKSNVRDLVTTTLEPFQSLLDLDGREILLPAETCFDLGLVLHELATNSAKYGALTGGGGRVSISWAVEAGNGAAPCFSLTWRDHRQDDQAISVSSGFGTQLIKQLIETKWSGVVETVREPRFMCRLAFPLPGNMASEQGRAATSRHDADQPKGDVRQEDRSAAEAPLGPEPGRC